MKILVYSVLFFVSQLLPAQSVKAVLEALVHGDKNYLDQNFATEVQYTLDQESYKSSKNEAIQSVLNFLGGPSVRTFKIVHDGVPKGKESFMGIGNVVSDKGKFRVYITFNMKEDKYRVSEIKIEKDGL